jgi:hypothetical protein
VLVDQCQGVLSKSLLQGRMFKISSLKFRRDLNLCKMKWWPKKYTFVCHAHMH